MEGPKNLAQLRRAMVEGKRFIILEHPVKKFVGQLREVNVVQTVGIYSVIAGAPDDPVSTSNAGKGYYLQWGRASEWSFSDDRCCFSKNGGTFLSFRIAAE